MSGEEFDDLHGSAMSLDAKLIARLRKALGAPDAERGVAGRRLIDDAHRLWARVRHFIAMRLVVAESIEQDALELAVYALQLPLRRGKTLTTGKPARATLRERAEEAAEMLVAIGEGVEEELLDRTIRILQELPQRLPILDEAKLLADALNLDDFGVTGLVAHAVQLGRQGDGITHLARGLESREAYGYWAARLKEGFHFDPVRQIAERRLESARTVTAMLLAELSEDRG